MPVPTAITDLSTTIASNFPAGSDSPSALDDVQRAHAAFIAQLRDGKGFTNPVTLASAATTDIGGQGSLSVEISGTTTITSFGTTYNGPRFLRFTGALVLTHASALNLPGAANITTVAGDTALAIPNQALTGWNVVAYQRNADITSPTGVLAVNGVALLHLNDIINGDFRIAQAGTSFAAPAGSAYDLDGWLNLNSSAAVFTVAQVAGSTPGRLARQVTITTADATVAVGEFVCGYTRIEGYNIEKYVGNTFTVAFRAKVPVTGVHCVAVRNAAGDRSYVKEINFPTANVWQNCSFTVTGGLPTAGTWNYTNSSGLEIAFTHLCGTDYQTTPDAWNTGNFLGTANQVNDCATNGNVWALEKVTMNLGTVAAVGEIDVGDELRRCQRYLPSISASAVDQSLGNGTQYSSSTVVWDIPFKVTPRVPPTGITASASNALKCGSNGSNVVSTSISFNSSSVQTCGVTIAAAGTSGAAVWIISNGTMSILFNGCRL